MAGFSSIVLYPRIEIHGRPMILPKLAGVPTEQNKYEVDVWLYMTEGVGEVILETVCDSEEVGARLISSLQRGFSSAKVVIEE